MKKKKIKSDSAVHKNQGRLYQTCNKKIKSVTKIAQTKNLFVVINFCELWYEGGN